VLKIHVILDNVNRDYSNAKDDMNMEMPRANEVMDFHTDKQHHSDFVVQP
jgi:hypothetical protein